MPDERTPSSGRMRVSFIYLLQLRIQHAQCRRCEILHSLFSPLGFRGVEQLQIVLADDLGGGRIVRGIPVVAVLVHGVFQAQDGVKELVADGAELKTGGEQRLVCGRLLGQAVEIVRGVAGGGVEGFGIVGDDVVIAEGFPGVGFVHGLEDGVEDDHIVPGAVAGVDVDVYHIFVCAVQAPGEYILQIHGGGFVAGAAVVDALGILVLSAQQGVGNRVRTLGDGSLAQAQIEPDLMPQGVSDFPGGAQEGIYLGVILVGGKIKTLPVQNEIPVQIHIVLVVAAHVLHAVGIHIGHHQHAGVVGIQAGINLPEEHIQHDGADVALDAVDAGGQDDQIGLLSGAGEIVGVDVQPVCLVNGVGMALRPKAIHQLLQMGADIVIAVQKGVAVSILRRRLALADGVQDQIGADQRCGKDQHRKDGHDRKQFLHKHYLFANFLGCLIPF